MISPVETILPENPEKQARQLIQFGRRNAYSVYIAVDI